MNVKIENGKLIIEIDMTDPTPSSTGKSLIVASTHGTVKVPVQVQGKPLSVSLNAYISAK